MKNFIYLPLCEQHLSTERSAQSATALMSGATPSFVIAMIVHSSSRAPIRSCCLPQAAAETLDGSGVDIGNWSAAQRKSRVFSHFRYSRRCDAATLRVPIEPLVGLLRHPFAVPGCLPQVSTVARYGAYCARTVLKAALSHHLLRG